MRHSTLPATLLAAALSLAGCASDVTNPISHKNAQLTQVPSQLPFAGRCETSFTFTGPNTIEIASVCQMRGIGRVTGVTQQTLDFSQVAQTGVIGMANTSVYTAPNGDQIFATFAGTGSQAGVTADFTGTETFTGGTGRFSNASGSVHATGSANLVTQTGYFTTEEQP